MLSITESAMDLRAGRNRLPPLSDPARRQLNRIRVLVLIPTLNRGGAEMDLVRTLPKIDRTRFRVTVCTFLERGELSAVLQAEGIEVIGPFSRLYPLHQLVRRLVRQIFCPLHRFFRGLIRQISTLPRPPRLVRRALGPIWSCLSRIGHALGHAASGCLTLARALWSPPRAIVYLLEIARIARPIAGHIRASEIQVIHTVLPNSYLVGAWASFVARRGRLLMSRLSLNAYQEDYRVVGFIERHILHRKVDAVVGNSKAVLRDLRTERVKEPKLHLIRNGIDVRAFTNEMVDHAVARELLGVAETTLVLTVVANLHPYKGHRDLLPALAALSRAGRPNWLCLFIGKDVHGELAELKRLCCDFGVADKVEFLGSRSDVPVILSASDIHVSASHQEGLPNNILEAMCARLPVVATAVGGVPELVVDGRTGYLLPPHDVERMAGALVALADAPARRKAFGEAGYARVASRFNIEQNVLAFETLYAYLARQPDTRAA
jgi:glycosyltransferase involved in cell wall biosynthesis